MKWWPITDEWPDLVSYLFYSTTSIRLQFFVLYFIFLSSNKQKNIWKSSWSTLGMGEKLWTNSVVHSIMFYYDLLCWFKLYLSTKIEPYSLYDILVIICMVIIVGSYIIVNFGYNIVSYKIPIIFLYVLFFCYHIPAHPNMLCSLFI